MPSHRKKHKRSSALNRLLGTPYEISKIVPKLASAAFSASESVIDEGRKSIADMGISSRKSIRKGRKHATQKLKGLVSDIPQVPNARAFVNLLEPLNENWLSVTIPGDIYARGVEVFMKKYESRGTKHIIGESEIRSVLGLLYGPTSYSQIPHILSEIFTDKASVNVVNVVGMLNVLFSDFINAEKNYQASVSVRSASEPGLGFHALKIKKMEDNIQDMMRKDVIIKLKENRGRQDRFLKAPKLQRPTPSDLYEMERLQKEAIGWIDAYRDESGLTDEDSRVSTLYLDYVLPLNEKYPELNQKRNKASLGRNKKSKKKTPKKRPKKRGKKKTQRVSRWF